MAVPLSIRDLRCFLRFVLRALHFPLCECMHAWFCTARCAHCLGHSVPTHAGDACAQLPPTSKLSAMCFQLILCSVYGPLGCCPEWKTRIWPSRRMLFLFFPKVSGRLRLARNIETKQNRSKKKTEAFPPPSRVPAAVWSLVLRGRHG